MFWSQRMPFTCWFSCCLLCCLHSAFSISGIPIFHQRYIPEIQTKPEPLAPEGTRKRGSEDFRAPASALAPSRPGEGSDAGVPQVILQYSDGTPAVMERLPAAIHPHIWQSTQPFFLDINRWAYGELNVPVYPESRIYCKVAQQICGYAENSPGILLRIKEKPNPFTGLRKSEYYDCEHI